MNLKERIDRCVKQWPEELEVTPIFPQRWREGYFVVPALHDAHQVVEQLVIGSVDEVPDRQIHTAILMILKEAAILLTVVYPRDLRHAEVARTLHSYMKSTSFDPELGYSDEDRLRAKQAADAAALMID